MWRTSRSVYGAGVPVPSGPASVEGEQSARENRSGGHGQSSTTSKNKYPVVQDPATVKAPTTLHPVTPTGLNPMNRTVTLY